MSRSHLLAAVTLLPFPAADAAPPPARVGAPSAPRPAPPPAARPVSPPVAVRPAPAPNPGGYGYSGYRGGYGVSGYRGGYPGYPAPYRPGVSVGVTFGAPYRYNYPLVLGGYASGGYYDPGYSGGYAANPVVIPYMPAAPPAPAPSAVPATSETALRVTEVTPGPAAEAGLRVGDIIYAVNGSRVQTGDELRKAVGSAAEVTVEFVKPQDGRTAAVTMAPRNGRVGITVEPIPVEFRK